MSQPAGAKLETLKRRAVFFGAANAFDYAMQFLLPVVLVRLLAPDIFGQYRLLWLAVTTVMMVAPLNMPGTLYYFLPRSDGEKKRLHVHMTVLYLGCAGLLGGLAMGPGSPLLHPNMRFLAEYGPLVPALIALFAVTSLLDMLPTAEERVGWQAGATLTVSLLRTIIVSLAAWLTGDLRVVIWALLAMMVVKLLVLLTYVARFHGLGWPWWRRGPFLEQIRHAAPFGIAGSLYGLRAQGDQWVAASLFALQTFAAFSLAAVLARMVNLFLESAKQAFLPRMSQMQATGDLHGMAELNAHANVMVGTVVYPLLAFVFVFAEEIVTVVYTPAYAAAASVMRVYVVGLLLFVVDLNSVMLLLREGKFALRLNLALAALSLPVSWFAAHRFGLAGAALGSTLALYGQYYATLRRIAAATGIPFGRLLAWRSLGRLLLIAAAAGAIALAVVDNYFAGSGMLLRMIVGGTVLASIYGALWKLSGPGARPFVAACSNRSGQ